MCLRQNLRRRFFFKFSCGIDIIDSLLPRTVHMWCSVSVQLPFISWTFANATHFNRQALLSPWLTFNPPSLPLHGFRLAHISDDHWDTRTALHTVHTPRIFHLILRPSVLSTTLRPSLVTLWDLRVGIKFSLYYTQLGFKKIKQLWIWSR